MFGAAPLPTASLIAQLAKNPPAMQETPAQFLGQEDLLEKGKAAHSSTLAWRIPMDCIWGRKELDMIEGLSLSPQAWVRLPTPTDPVLLLRACRTGLGFLVFTSIPREA